MTTEEKLEPRRSNKRLLLGIGVLFVVNIIWVVSSELSEFIFHDSDFDKPFFTTYFKTSIFLIYFLGFVFLKRWRYQLRHFSTGNETFEETLREIENFNNNKQRTSKDQELHQSPAGHGSVSVKEIGKIDQDIGNPNKNDDINDDDGTNDDRRNAGQRIGNVSVKHQKFAQMSEAEIQELKNLLTAICKKLSLRYTVILALAFVFLWLFATLMYQYALSKTSAAVTNILSSTSGIFTLLLAAVFPSSPSDKFNVSKMLSVLVSFGGIFLICWTDPNRTDTSINVGDIYALLSAVGYACYLVLARKKAGDEGKLDIPLFFGFVGLFGLLFFWPMFFILHYTGLETFELPRHNMTWLYLTLNAVIGTAISELLWLWGCFLTSSLMATLALGFVLPITMIWDILFNHIKFSMLFFIGTVPVIVSFISISLLTHYQHLDPVKVLLTKYVCRRKQTCKVDVRDKEDYGNENEAGCSNNAFNTSAENYIENDKEKH